MLEHRKKKNKTTVRKMKNKRAKSRNIDIQKMFYFGSWVQVELQDI